MNNWHNSLRRVKNCNKGKSGEKDFGLMAGRKKRVHFFGKNCEKCMGKKQRRKRKARRVNCKIKCQ